jgi:hypothetical protein
MIHTITVTPDPSTLRTGTLWDWRCSCGENDCWADTRAEAEADGAAHLAAVADRLGAVAISVFDQRGPVAVYEESDLDIPPNGCRWCGAAKGSHYQRWSPGPGWHTHAEPADAQRKARMIARRLHRLSKENAR